MVLLYAFSLVMLKNSMLKGSLCSINGQKYELQIYNIVKKCKLNNKMFNTQYEYELGGCSSNNDIECNFNSIKDIPIEIKKINTPDWMQCSLKYDNNKRRWCGSVKNKIPDKSKKIFEDLIKDTILFDNIIPPFIFKKLTYNEWINIKKETNIFNDIYINCENDIIKKLYNEKKCNYIQISNKGLYHLDNDICNFNVPEFICEQQLRVRIKIHTKKDNNGYCKLSTIISCQPKNIKNLINSNFSLDNILKLPSNLIYTTTD